jgi:hypothetical protein
MTPPRCAPTGRRTRGARFSPPSGPPAALVRPLSSPIGALAVEWHRSPPVHRRSRPRRCLGSCRDKRRVDKPRRSRRDPRPAARRYACHVPPRAPAIVVSARVTPPLAQRPVLVAPALRRSPNPRTNRSVSPAWRAVEPLLHAPEAVWDPSVAEARGRDSAIVRQARHAGPVRHKGVWSAASADWDFGAPVESQIRAEPHETEGIAMRSYERGQCQICRRFTAKNRPARTP